MELAPCHMPADTRDNHLVRTIINDHAVAQVRLADLMHCSEGYISRVLDGQYAVPAAMTRALFTLTRDPRLFGLSLGIKDAADLARSPALDKDLDTIRDRLASVGELVGQAQRRVPRTATTARLDLSA
jgi:hypothetical protein